MSTLTKSDVSAIGQTIDRALRHLRHSRQLSAARQRGDTVAQLEHSLHVADTRIGMAKSPSEADHWRTVHRECRKLIDEAGFAWRAGRLVDPSRRTAPERKSMAKSFASPARAAEYSELRSELLQSLAKARSESDFETRMERFIRADRHGSPASSGCGRSEWREQYAASGRGEHWSQGHAQ